ncbi:MAG TPA: GldG family protein [Burkholderiales bacterium]|nr:GldG family protein [Burkholderiales bacterium]
MKASRRMQVQLLAQNTLFGALLVAAAVLGVYLLDDVKLQRDVTQNKRGSLSQATRDVLGRMQGPIVITAYATHQDPVLGDVRRVIHDFVAPYIQVKPDIGLEFIDPREQPKQTAAANVRANGELVIEYGKRSEHLTSLNEQNMANLLMRLARSQERLIMHVDGHGEPKLDGGANFDLGEFGRQLGTKGFRVQGLNLLVAPEVPDNVDVLVVTHPRTQMIQGEVSKIIRHLDRGGSLLWLVDQEPLRGLQSLAEYLKVELTPGVVVDPAAAQLGIQPTIALSSNYGFHPVTENFTQYNTAFPFARAIGRPAENGEWRATALVEVAQNGWVETGDLRASLRFDKDRDVRGPVAVAVALEREVKGKPQRVVAVGGSGFLTNAFVGLLSNLDLGTNMLNWLAEDESLITIQPRARVDSTLELSRAALIAIVTAFLLALPAAFLFAGGAIWWRRRRA